MAKKRGSSGKFGQKGSAPVRLEPDLAMLMRLVEGEKFAEVETAARRFLAKKTHPLALKALSFALIGLDRHADALPIVDAALALVPNDPELHNNRGIVLCVLMRREASVASFNRAIELDPGNFEYYKHLGTAYASMAKRQEAIRYLSKAIELCPDDDTETVELLTLVMLEARHYEQALTCADAMISEGAGSPRLRFAKVAASLRLCRWAGMLDEIEALKQKYLGETAKLAENPMSFAAFPNVSRRQQRIVSENFGLERAPQIVRVSRRELPTNGELPRGRRIRIGYLSPDFMDHPVGRVVSELFERTPRNRFELFGYSLSADDSAVRKRLVASFDHFRDIEPLWIDDAVRLIRDDGLDILVDLAGYTLNARPELFAMRCAPIQAGWVGYPGTMGIAGSYEYLIGDPVVTPLSHADDYVESIAQLPRCYLPADTTRLPGTPPSRAAAGLPEKGFVFGSHNNSYKLNPAVFDLWCGLLRDVSGSVLWLSAHGPAAEASLRAEAEARGVAGDRLIFARRTPDYSDHLDRLALIDLALDPFPYNSHSSGIDVLWAGVPMVSLEGETFAARVGASLLRNVGLDEFIVQDVETYRALVLSLVGDPSRLGAARRHLTEGRRGLPLFDMAGYAEHLGSLFERMIADAAAGRIGAIAANDY